MLLHVEVDGARDAPLTVVFVHGCGASLSEWRHQRAALAPHARLVLFDQRGHGRSGWAHPRQSTVDQLGEDLRAVLRDHAGDRPVVLVSHSLGGMAYWPSSPSTPSCSRAPSRAWPFTTGAGRQLLHRRLFSMPDADPGGVDAAIRDVSAPRLSVLVALAPSMLHDAAPTLRTACARCRCWSRPTTFDATIPVAHSRRLFEELQGWESSCWSSAPGQR